MLCDFQLTPYCTSQTKSPSPPKKAMYKVGKGEEKVGEAGVDYPSVSDDDDMEGAAGADDAAGDVDKDATMRRKHLKKSAGGWGTTISDLVNSKCREHVHTVLLDCLGADNYKLVGSVQVLQMRLHVYVLAKHHEHVSQVKEKSENAGIGGIVGNKGGE